MLQSQESLLLGLAPELTQIISDELDLDSVKQLRLSCKQLAELHHGRILRRLTIDITKNRIENGIAKVVTLATSNHAARQATRELFIRSLSPAFDPDYQGPRWSEVDQRWVAESEPEDPSEVALAEEKMRLHLFRAIDSLKGVQTVLWMPRAKDPGWAHSIIMVALQNFPNLANFRISLSFIKVPPAIGSLKGLKQIYIDGTCDEETIDSLAKAVAQSPQIVAIDIPTGWKNTYTFNKKRSLHQLFKYCPPDAAPLRLRHLGLKTWLVRLDEVTLPHLKHLTSLELVNIEDPYARSPYSSDDSNETEKEKKRYGSSLEEIWKTVRSTGVRLEQITVDVVTSSFLDYLSSYSGLKKLYLTAGGFLEGTSSDAMARKFFAKPIHKHSQSLEDLKIAALYEGLWCFSDHNLPTISKCTSLKSLRISIISSHLWKDDDHAKSAPNSDVIKLLLDTAVVYLPDLENLRIDAANLEHLRRARCGNPAMSHFSCVGPRMIRSAHNYIAPPSCCRLPLLKIGAIGPVRSFTAGSGSHDSQRGPLTYVDTFPPTKGWEDLDWPY